MNKLWLAVALVSIFGISAVGEMPEQQTEFTGAGIFYQPGQDDDYDNGFGAEGQARFWMNSNVGLALSLGVASWQINEQDRVMSDGLYGAGASIDGNVVLIPFGGSVLYRPINENRIAITLEGGIRYVLVDSNAEIEAGIANAYGAYVYGKDTIKMDNGVIGIIGLNIESKVSRQLSFLAGLHYQFDIVKGETEWIDYKLSKNELKAIMFKVGLALKI